MKNNLEKIKDILYNISDYIIMACIIITIGLIISWRLDILFPQSTTMIESNTLSEKEIEGSKDLIDRDKDFYIKESDSDENSDINQSNEKEKPKEEHMEKEPPETEPLKEEPKIIKISIPKGAPSADIGDILVRKGLASSTEEFEKKVKKMDLEKNLRSGKYEIESDSSLEEVIKIVANQK